MSLHTPKFYDGIISLGRNCHLRWFLKKINLYKLENSIFDNMYSNSLDKVCDLLETKFESFFDFENLEKCGENPWSAFSVYDKKNNIFSYHDFYQDLNIETYKNFKRKKNKQIENFYESIKKYESLLFIRVNHRKEKLENTIRLFDVIQNIRKNKTFDLYVFQNSRIINQIPKFKNLHAFYDKDWVFNNGTWNGDEDLWNLIFKFTKVKNDIKH